MREAMRKPERGTAMLLEHVRAIQPQAPRKPAFERLSVELGHELAAMLVGALSSQTARAHSSSALRAA
jgi:hypothetical protein